VSSQFVTALMLIGPALPAGLEIRLTSPLVSRPYVAITAAVMADFGIDGAEVGAEVIRVPHGTYRARDHRIEPDASSASYPLAAAAICGGRVRVEGLGTAALQGDAAFADLLGAMGCTVERTDDAVTVSRAGQPLVGIDIDMSDISDLVPTVATVAAFATTPTRIRGVGFIRGKESDRLGDLAAELARLGITAVEHADGLEVLPSSPHAGTVDTHHDHRLAMALSLVGLVTPGVVVRDPAVVSKSWPDWWGVLDRLAGR
jgi:3-phosphoshikimate 1-carboxyvinyltransferase